MYSIAIVFALIASASASYLAPAAPAAYAPAPLAAPVLHAPSFTTSAHVGNVQSASRSYTNVPQSRFQRTDWVQPGSVITQGIFSPVLAPTYGQVAVRGPDRIDSYLVPRAPLVENTVHHVPGVAHVPTLAAAYPAPVAVAAPAAYGPAPAAYGPAPVAAPAYGPAPVAVKGY